MDAALKNKWIEALESGKYEQGRHALKSTDGKYCCLGVLCEIAGVENEVRGNYDPEAYMFTYKGDKDLTYLPDAFAKEIGLSGPMQDNLAGMNDGGTPFHHIAEFIRERFLTDDDPVAGTD